MIGIDSFDDLSGLYRTELKNAPLASVPKDLYVRMRRLEDSLERRYKDELGRDPDSQDADIARQTWRKTHSLACNIMHTRAAKVCHLAINDFRKGLRVDHGLPDRDAELYDSVYATLCDTADVLIGRDLQ